MRHASLWRDDAGRTWTDGPVSSAPRDLPYVRGVSGCEFDALEPANTGPLGRNARHTYQATHRLSPLIFFLGCPHNVCYEGSIPDRTGRKAEIAPTERAVAILRRAAPAATLSQISAAPAEMGGRNRALPAAVVAWVRPAARRAGRGRRAEEVGGGTRSARPTWSSSRPCAWSWSARRALSHLRSAWCSTVGQRSVSGLRPCGLRCWASAQSFPFGTESAWAPIPVAHSAEGAAADAKRLTSPVSSRPRPVGRGTVFPV